MARTPPPQVTPAEVRAELAALEDPRMRAVNARHGDDHGVDLSGLRGLGRRLTAQQPLARELVLADHPTPRGRTSPFAPVWIAAIVRRRALQDATARA
ncbi:MAG: hypothetical protein JWQ53_2792 [Klenkia sp.]|nr:hypothetical protein [Klenkia sp.]